MIASRLHTGGGAVVGMNSAFWISKHCASLFVVKPQNIDYQYAADASVRELVCPRQTLVRQAFWDRRVLGPALIEFQPDWVFSMGNYPVAGKWRQSVLIHDPHFTFDRAHFRNETFRNKSKKWIGRRLLLSRLQNVQRFYCQTEAIRAGASQLLGIPVDKIGLFPPGVDAAVGTQPNGSDLLLSTALKKVLGYRGRFRLFYPARCYGHKNHRVILEAYSKYRDELKDTVCFWTISASDHAIAPELLSRVRNEGLGDQIVNLGPVSQGEVQSIFKESDSLLMPTKLETFGIPFVEAMQNGCPIIASSYAFVKAVCGTVPLYLEDADSPSEVRDAICTLRDDEAKRKSLIAAGVEHVSKMKTWEEAVASVLKDEGIG